MASDPRKKTLVHLKIFAMQVCILLKKFAINASILLKEFIANCATMRLSDLLCWLSDYDQLNWIKVKQQVVLSQRGNKQPWVHYLGHMGDDPRYLT